MYCQVCSTTRHPGYNSGSVDNDFSVLRLCSPVSFSRHISTACLPSSSNMAVENVQVSLSPSQSPARLLTSQSLPGCGLRLGDSLQWREPGQHLAGGQRHHHVQQ